MEELWWDTPRPWLVGAALVWRRWEPPSGDEYYDHDHCEFCHAKFMEDAENTLHEGYTTADTAIWICSDCFNIPTLRERFKLTLATT